MKTKTLMLGLMLFALMAGSVAMAAPDQDGADEQNIEERARGRRQMGRPEADDLTQGRRGQRRLGLPWGPQARHTERDAGYRTLHRA